jgi:hypothetical protein
MVLGSWAGSGRHRAGGDTEAFWLALSVGFVVQAYKGVAYFATRGRWNFRRFVETGGMPSAHSAAVSALTTMVGFDQGFRSTLFGVCLYFSLIVMYDAAGLRRAAGKQAAILNRLIDEHFEHAGAETGRLIELLGHTPLEVLVGALLGLFSAVGWHWYFGS